MGKDIAAESGKKRKKVTDDAVHRTGTLRAAVKPGVTVGKPSVAKIISDYVEAKGARAFQRTLWGGFHMLDGKGGSADLSWELFANCTISISRGMLVIGKVGITSPDSEELAELLQTIKASLS